MSIKTIEEQLADKQTAINAMNFTITHLRGQVESLQQLALAGEWRADCYGEARCCPRCGNDIYAGHTKQCAYVAARNAGWLPEDKSNG